MQTTQQIAFSQQSLLASSGYLTGFIDPAIQIDHEGILPASCRKILPEVTRNKKGILNYTNLSVFYNSERKVPFVSAYNIDGGLRGTGIKRANNFRDDFRIDTSIQLGNAFYDLRTDITEFEIGHMAANNEMAWGADAQIKAYQTFHFPNSVPQAEGLNTGLWKSLESYMIKEAAGMKGNQKISVFTGPVLDAKDPFYVEDPGFKIPLLFYKVIVFMDKKGLYSTGFIMSQEKKLRQLGMFAKPAAMKFDAFIVPEQLAFEDFKFNKVFQVNIAEIEELSGLNFKWKNVKQVKVENRLNQIKQIKGIASSDDAKKVQGQVNKQSLNFQEIMLVDGFPSPLEVKKNNFRLNIILP